MSIADRIAALRQGLAPAPTAHPAQAPGTARRTGRLSISAGAVDVEPEPAISPVAATAQAPVASVQEPVHPPPPAPKEAGAPLAEPLPSPRPRGSRFGLASARVANHPKGSAQNSEQTLAEPANKGCGAIKPQAKAVDQNPVPTQPAAQQQPLPEPAHWPSQTTPPGSMYTDEQWQQAQQANPDCTVFEMIKSGEHALLAVPGLDPELATLYSHSLVVDLRAKHLVPWAEQYANAHLEHTSVEHGQVRYAIIRSACARNDTAYLNGSVVRIVDPGATAPARPSATRMNRYTATSSAPKGLTNIGTDDASSQPSARPRSERFAAAIERMR